MIMGRLQDYSLAYYCQLGDRLPLGAKNRPRRIILVAKELERCLELPSHCLAGFGERSAGVVIVVLERQILYSIDYLQDELRGFSVSFDY
jgi:hypothetical protein